MTEAIVILGKPHSAAELLEALPSLLSALAENEENYVFESEEDAAIKRILKDDNADKHLLSKLLELVKTYKTYSFQQRLIEIVGHRNLPKDELERLYQSKDTNVMAGLARNPNTSDEVLDKLLLTKKEDVLCGFAEREDCTEEMLKAILKHKSDLPRSFLAISTSDPDLLRKIFESSGSLAFGTLAEHSATPIDLLKELVECNKEEVVAKLLDRADIDEEILQLIVKTCAKMVEIIPRAILHDMFPLDTARKLSTAKKVSPKNTKAIWAKLKVWLSDEENVKEKRCVAVDSGSFVFIRAEDLRSMSIDYTHENYCSITIKKGPQTMLLYVLDSWAPPSIFSFDFDFSEPTEFVFVDNGLIQESTKKSRFFKSKDFGAEEGKLDGCLFDTEGDGFFDVGIVVRKEA
jgi:sulfur relay (sulfurtransferase) DsrF/TusC family protein